jgi:hypothetical protein
MACPVKLTLTMILCGFFLFRVTLCSFIQHGSQGCRFDSYRFFPRNEAQLVRAIHCCVLHKSHYSHTLLNCYCYCSAVVTLNIAITIVNVPYEGFGSSFYYIIAYKGK